MGLIGVPELVPPGFTCCTGLGVMITVLEGERFAGLGAECILTASDSSALAAPAIKMTAAKTNSHILLCVLRNMGNFPLLVECDGIIRCLKSFSKLFVAFVATPGHFLGKRRFYLHRNIH